jgi:hypothetical protein
MFNSSLIEVVFRDGTRGRVAPKALDLFLKTDKISRFKRSSGWATVGIDPIREEGESSAYRGPERRASGPFCLLPLVA